MLLTSIFAWLALSIAALAQTDYPTGTSVTYASRVTQTLSQSTTASVILSANSSISQTALTSSSATRTLLVGSSGGSTTSGTSTGLYNATSTSTSAQPTNTVPCNGYAEFCTRQYSNITMVAAHNSPFDVSGNAASNQMFDVTTQLNDGIRMLQFETHYYNKSMFLCHTSCELLNAGTLESYLTTVVSWLKQNPDDVITILMGNQDFVNPENYTGPVTNSGLLNYIYTPPTTPMNLTQWPTLGSMILRNQRVVLMLDYLANQTSIPWLLDEFSQMWETPFSPTNRGFPCTEQRPPSQSTEISESRMYMANHNLNVAVDLLGTSILLTAPNILNETNAVSGYGSLGLATSNCTSMWNRPPNFLLVDYYNIGNFNGSVFQVAATANGVSYDKASCCDTSGTSTASAAIRKAMPDVGRALAGLGILMVLVL